MLPLEQAVALTDEDSPAYLPGFFQIALGSVIDSPPITERARSGDGLGWGEHVHDVHEWATPAVWRTYRPRQSAPGGLPTIRFVWCDGQGSFTTSDG